MAPKVPKKPLKSMEKHINPPFSKIKKKKKKGQSFDMYIYKVLKSVGEPNTMGITRKSMDIMNSFVNDWMEKISLEAGRLAAHSKKNTLTAREIQSAVKLVLPGQLAVHANSDSLKALNSYKKSFPEQSSQEY